ncbi:helix-turn-helix domain-containing protein [Lacticaseibacillus suilingensis]|jgi:transcriptional regulator with XRE-family HTH domain|uniref:Helix-turn-helix domain-containing protein n=3 Tax=Lacticaseibacillus TaxID=2759736 RepID=A0ABW4BHR0_9LACO|nr:MULTISPECIES: helix-turn-helix transcriptional regulator [Lactobacillaceae]MCI1913835.1 helix-turn-helix domain-containing protein [Schleiferilactobacillus harbinensis]
MTKVHYFGPNLKRLRIQSGLSQAELGAALDTPVNGQAISNWERENNHPTYENLIGIAKFFNVMPSELLRTEKETAVGETTAILDRIDEYMPKVTEIRRVMHMMKDFSPRQLDGLSEQLDQIMQYFRPYTPVDEDGEPETDQNGRKITKQSKYRDIPIKEIHQVYQELKAIQSYRDDQQKRD